MVLVLLLNGVMVMVTRFSTVILCLAAGISILFLVLYWRFCRSSTELRGALFCGGSVIAYLAVLFAVILAWLVREHFAEVSPFVVYLVSIAIVALCSGVSWISVGRKLRGTAAPKASRTGRTVSYIVIGAISYIVARLIFSGIGGCRLAGWHVGAPCGCNCPVVLYVSDVLGLLAKAGRFLTNGISVQRLLVGKRKGHI